MTDLVQRLRARHGFFRNGGTWCMGSFLDSDCQESADRIEQLEAALREIADPDHVYTVDFQYFAQHIASRVLNDTTK